MEMSEPVVESVSPTMVVEEIPEGDSSSTEMKQQLASKNGKATEASGGSSFFTWFMVLALLGVWTSVAVVYFDLVDYQGVLAKAKDLRINLSEAIQGKLVSYDTDGDGDFDVEDAKVLLDEKPGDVVRKQGPKENPLTKDVGWKLREALKQQLALIHERVEAKKIAKLALAEVRNILAKEDEEKALGLRRDEATARAKEKVVARLKEEEEQIEMEETEKAMERLKRAKEGVVKEEEEEAVVEEKEKEGKKAKKGAEKKGKKDGEGDGKKGEKDDKTKSKELLKAAKKSKGDKSD